MRDHQKDSPPDVERRRLAPTTGRARRQGRAGEENTAMKYLMLTYGNQEKWASFPAEAWPEAIARQEAFNATYRQTGELLSAYGLADVVNSVLVRRQDGAPVVTDGPYIEAKEYIASLYLLDVQDEERARQIAADMPFADREPVEVWPILHESSAEA
jgi:hypothetical protein